MPRILPAAALAVSAMLAAPSSEVQAGSYNGLEIPRYEVLLRQGAFELRRYAPHLAAEVRVRGTQNAAASKAFRMLAGFIFGKNVPAEKIAMTAPVTQSQGDKIAMTAPVTQEEANGVWTVRFMMPSRYSAETLPRPTNDAVRIVTVDPGSRVVVTFSGTTHPMQVARRTAELRAFAAAQGLELAGPAELARYNDPFTAPWRRRNEVSFQVR